MTTFDMSTISNDLSNFTPEHVFLVGISVRGDTRPEAESTLMGFLPRPNGLPDPSPVECWWIAEDARNDRSDNDSAVWVAAGAQQAAHDLLRSVGFTGKHNKPHREGGQFTGDYEPPNHGVSRYEKARAVRDLMATLSIGIGDLDLIDALDSLVEGEALMHEHPRIEPQSVPAAFEALAPHGEYEWHGSQEHLWEQLREHTRDEVREAGLLIETDNNEED